jgi:hypothetical protein
MFDPNKLSPTTRQLMVGGLCVIGLGSILGAAFGNLEMQDTMMVTMAIITGFFTLLKGED